MLNAYRAFYSDNRISPPSALFNELTDAYYFAKDKQGRFIYANKLLSERFNLHSADSVFLKTDFDFFRPDIAEQIRRDDERVMSSKQAIHKKLEIVNDRNNELLWLYTSKSPLFNIDGELVGIEGLSIDATKTQTKLQPFRVFKDCIHFIQHNYMKPILVSELAAMSNMSLSTFERQFKQHLGSTPVQYIKQVRIHQACYLLSLGRALQDVALATGFCDQSYFTKEFKKIMKTTPRSYREECAGKVY